jgi:probable rRNA maturation factor
VKVLISNRQRKVKINTRQVERDTAAASRLLNLEKAELSLLFVGPARMRALNARYRGIHKTTDVLSFPMYASRREFPEGEFLLGDVVIDAWQAHAQARQRGVPLRRELRRLLIHGLLHLLGYNHEKNSYHRRKMAAAEREILGQLP